ncbi:(4Fe-4S)-binding protein [Staphylococcus felis]|nr:(4Fe-4S)-binding protein [Staphylococcus felis]
MRTLAKQYTGNDIDVFFEPKRCIHAAECVKNLPSVFDTSKRPWVDPSQSDADTIARVVELCPSGALTYNRKDGAPNEHHDHTEVTIGDDNQIYLRGEATIKWNDETIYVNRAILKGDANTKEYPFYTKNN